VLAIVVAAILIAVAVRYLPPLLSPPGAVAQQSRNGGQPAGQSGGKQGAGQKPAVPVFATAATARNVPIMIRGIGSVQAFNTVAVKSRVDGTIIKVAFQEGHSVRAGDLLVQIDPRPYQAQLEQAEANKAKDQANLDNARRDLARVAALVKTGLAATQQQYETQQATVAQLTAAVQADQAQIDAARLNLAYSSITSPIDGITGVRLVDVGNLVSASAGTTLVTVTQIKPIFVAFTVPERDLERIRATLAQHAVTVLAYSGDDQRQLAEGRLTVINNVVDPATGSVTLKAQFPNQDAALWPGQFVNAHLVVETLKGAVTVPSAAVMMGPQGPFVYLIKPDSTVEARSVVVTQVENNVAAIGKGLAVGDKVVTSGQQGLSPGAKVDVQQGQPGQLIAQEPQVGPEGVGSTGVTTPPPGAGGTTAR
jgi:multidrug efflux system membrane fusion protein